MADTDADAAGREAREKLVFEQELNEVHLLIDFVSGRSDRSLASLQIPDPEGGDKPTLNAGQIVTSISLMRYPPIPNQSVANGRNAAILLLAKDQLSALATPARGFTIAYTAMFVDAEASQRLLRWLRLALPDRFTQKLGFVIHKDARLDLAAQTFPALQDHARLFSAWRTRFALLTLIWLFLTCLTYWDAGLGRAALERLDHNWKTQLEEATNNPLLLRCVQTPISSKTGDKSAPVKDQGQGPQPEGSKSALDIFKSDQECRRYNYATWLSWSAGKEVNSVFECDRDHKPFHVWCWRWLLSGTYSIPSVPDPKDATAPKSATDGGDVPEYVKANATYWQTATLILMVYTTFILPMMFAMLGALIGGFRAIIRLISDSALAPRDLVRMQLGVPIGLVAGIAVGLLFSSSSVPIQGTGSIAGQLTLTASGLAFLAGYASERFFRFLDSATTTIFPDQPNSQTTRPAASQPSAPQSH